MDDCCMRGHADAFRRSLKGWTCACACHRKLSVEEPTRVVSRIIRYDVCPTWGIEEAPDGEFVRYADVFGEY